MAESKRAISWSSPARSDLSEIWNYYARVAGRQTADKIVRQISEAWGVLEDYPFAGRDRSEVNAALRSVVAGPHVIFYRVKENAVENRPRFGWPARPR
jgi:plasmid stabilization system protein ParE